jgi:hypothetical protein
MRLDRNENNDGKGKYAIINLRTNVVEHGRVGDPDEFFVMKLRDKHSKAALLAYAESIQKDDYEFALDVFELASRAGVDSPHHRKSE